VRELHPRGLGFAQSQFGLKVLVHDINHSVANSPEEEQRTDEYERDDQIFAVVRYEHALVVCLHGIARNVVKNVIPVIR